MDMGVATLCARGLIEGGLAQRQPWEASADGDNRLSLQAGSQQGDHHASLQAGTFLGGNLGRFTYSSSEYSWIYPPGLPDSERTTRFESRPKFLPGAQIDVSRKGFVPSLVLAEYDFVSVKAGTRLAFNGAEVMSVGLAPTLALQVQISPRGLVNELAKTTAEVRDVATAEDLVTKEISGDVGAAIKVEGEGFYGMTPGQIDAKIASAEDPQLFEEFKTWIANMTPSSDVAAAFRAQGVTADEGFPPEAAPALEGGGSAVGGTGESPTPADFSPDAAGALDGEVSGAVDVRFACIMIFGGPEDLAGDLACSL